MRRVLHRVRARVSELLEREAKVRDLVKATIPLWVLTLAGAGAGFLVLGTFNAEQDRTVAQLEQVVESLASEQVDSCVRGREDIVEFVHRLIALNEPDTDPGETAALEALLDDFVADCTTTTEASP